MTKEYRVTISTSERRTGPELLREIQQLIAERFPGVPIAVIATGAKKERKTCTPPLTDFFIDSSILPGFEGVAFTKIEARILTELAKAMNVNEWRSIQSVRRPGNGKNLQPKRFNTAYLHLQQILEEQGDYALETARGVRVFRFNDNYNEIHGVTLPSPETIPHLTRNPLYEYLVANNPVSDEPLWFKMDEALHSHFGEVAKILREYGIILSEPSGGIIRLVSTKPQEVPPQELQPLSLENLRDFVIVASALGIHYSEIIKLFPSIPPEKDIAEVESIALPDAAFTNRPIRRQAIEHLVQLGNSYVFTDTQNAVLTFLREAHSDTKKYEELLRIVAEKPTSSRR